MAKKSAKKKTVGQRYTEAEKEKILAYVDKINASKGRGGPAAAYRKYGISPITITSWMKKRGGNSSGGKVSGGNPLKRMSKISDKVAKLEAEISALEKEYAKLRKKI